MKKLTIGLRIFVVSVGVFMAFSLIYTTHLSNIKNKNYQFNGRVEYVSYDGKREATVLINDTDYYLSYPNWDFDHDTIKVGDSMIKLKNSFDIKLLKSNGEVILHGDNN
jgi:hypothetical protein